MFLKEYNGFTLDSLPSFNTDSYKDAEITVIGFINPIDDLSVLPINLKSVNKKQWHGKSEFCFVPLTKDGDIETPIERDKDKNIVAVTGVLIELTEKFFWTRFIEDMFLSRKRNKIQLAADIEKFTEFAKNLTNERKEIANIKKFAELKAELEALDPEMKKRLLEDK